MARIAFVDSMGVEKLGLLYLSSVLKQQGHEVDVFLEPFEPRFIETLKAYRPDVVGFGSFVGQEPDVIELFALIKTALDQVVTVQGGPSTMIYADLIYHPAVDFVLKGDAEESLPALTQAVELGGDLAAIPGLLWKDGAQVVCNAGAPLTRDFDSFPPADRDLHMKYPRLRHSRTKPFLMTRGCPFPCTFCGTATLNRIFKQEKGGPHFRYGVFERTLTELEYVRDTYGLEWVQFHDATFNAKPSFAMEFLEQYAARDLPGFICNIRSESVSEELVRQMKAARCDRVTMGIQSGNETIRKTLSGRRSQTDENIRYACSLFKKYGIRVHIDLIFGWPGETIEQGLETIALARELDVYKVNNNIMIYYPDSPITQYAHENGYLAQFPDVFDVPELANPLASPILHTPDIQKLINLDKLAHYLIKSPVLSSPPVRQALLGVKPNRLYHLLKNLPALRVSLIYDARDFEDKVAIVRNYLNAVIKMNRQQFKQMRRAARTRQAVLNYKNGATRREIRHLETVS